jgi:hypothetical protein
MQKKTTGDTVKESQSIYVRQLPGGGFVTIEAASFRTVLGLRKYRGEVRVERRVGAARRTGHNAPVIASTEATTIGSVFHDLFPIAQSNVAIATGCLAVGCTVARADTVPASASIVANPAA